MRNAKMEEIKKYERVELSISFSDDVISTSGDDDRGEWLSLSLRPIEESGYNL